MKITVIVQARICSTRLPGKVMKIIKNKTILGHVITRIKKAKNVSDVIIATTDKHSDDIIVEEAKKLNVKYFRGSEEDVLSRYYYAAKDNKSDIIIRITSDCPVIDPKIIDIMVEEFLEYQQKEHIDYLSNTVERTFPRGLDIEILKFDILERCFYDADKDYEREHVTPYIYLNEGKFKIKQYKNTLDYSNYRWTLDTIEDFQVIEKIYDNLYREDELFYFEDILKFIIDHPEIAAINKDIEQKKLGQ